LLFLKTNNIALRLSTINKLRHNKQSAAAQEARLKITLQQAAGNALAIAGQVCPGLNFNFTTNMQGNAQHA
jgi:hypothetical protein